jgi:hypothetical protein
VFVGVFKTKGESQDASLAGTENTPYKTAIKIIVIMPP